MVAYTLLEVVVDALTELTIRPRNNNRLFMEAVVSRHEDYQRRPFPLLNPPTFCAVTAHLIQRVDRPRPIRIVARPAPACGIKYAARPRAISTTATMFVTFILVKLRKAERVLRARFDLQSTCLILGAT